MDGAVPVLRALGPYQLEELLGRGGMAEVYRARRNGPAGFEKVLALKRILPSYARDPRLVARFLEEARLTARLDHPNIVHVVDFGGVGGEFYLVMEWVDGVSLSAIVRALAARGAALPADAAAYVVAEAAEGLWHAHTATDESGRPLGIVHRDVSPQNILVSRNGGVKVSDFGIAKAIGSSVRTATGVQIGKLCYMSPEQAGGGTVDVRSDIYALGVVLWECLVGRPLFPRGLDEKSLQAVIDPHVPPPSSACSSPVALDAIVAGALAPRPADRTPDARSLARALRVWLHGVAPGFGPGELASFLDDAAVMPTRAGSPAPPRATPAAPAPAAVATVQPPTKREIPEPPAPAAPEARAVVEMPRVGAISTVPKAASDAPAQAAPVASTAPSAIALAPSEPAAPPPAPRPPRRAGRIGTGLTLGLLAIPVLTVAAIAVIVLTLQARDEAPPSTPASSATQLVPVAPAGAPLLRTEPPGALVIAGHGVIGTTPLLFDASKMGGGPVGLLLVGHTPIVLRDAVPESAGPVQLVRTDRVYGLLEVDCPMPGRVLVDGQDLGTQPALVVVELLGGSPRTSIAIEGAGPLALAGIVRPWELTLVRQGSGCVP